MENSEFLCALISNNWGTRSGTRLEQDWNKTKIMKKWNKRNKNFIKFLCSKCYNFKNKVEQEFVFWSLFRLVPFLVPPLKLRAKRIIPILEQEEQEVL
jgi:hypothetical protein